MWVRSEYGFTNISIFSIEVQNTKKIQKKNHLILLICYKEKDKMEHVFSSSFLTFKFILSSLESVEKHF